MSKVCNWIQISKHYNDLKVEMKFSDIARISDNGDLILSERGLGPDMAHQFIEWLNDVYGKPTTKKGK